MWVEELFFTFVYSCLSSLGGTKYKGLNKQCVHEQMHHEFILGSLHTSDSN